VDGITPSPTGQVAGYPFFRPLFMCYDKNEADADKKKLVNRYICDVLGELGQSIASEVRYLPLSPTEVSAEFAEEGCLTVAAADTFEKYTGGDFQDCKDIRSVVITGSSTVYPITSNSESTCGSNFVNIVTGSSGSSVGIATFLAGGNDLAAASRALRPKDYAAFECDSSAIDPLGNANALCQGKEPKSMIIGRDMLSIIVNPASTLECLDITDLKDIFAGDNSDGYSLCGADKQSGTRDFFEEEIG